MNSLLRNVLMAYSVCHLNLCCPVQVQCKPITRNFPAALLPDSTDSARVSRPSIFLQKWTFWQHLHPLFTQTKWKHILPRGSDLFVWFEWPSRLEFLRASLDSLVMHLVTDWWLARTGSDIFSAFAIGRKSQNLRHLSKIGFVNHNWLIFTYYFFRNFTGRW